MQTAPASMQWSKLLNWQRFGASEFKDIDASRPPWQMDYDRIVFSSAFRRLQDKTQVFPLSGSDYVRTRLTHSMEVSTVARTLGMMAGKVILDRHKDDLVWRYPEGKPPYQCKLEEAFTAADFGAIIAVAALAHDMGNPPFGHSGEDAVRHWFKHSPCGQAAGKTLANDSLAREFQLWEGNAQGFRILTRLQLYRAQGGMRLTYATLGAFTKYPASATAVRTPGAWKKFGFFQAEAEAFSTIADMLGLIPRASGGWCRHPLAYLMEAADDVCYRIIDFEDGVRLGRIHYAEAEVCLLKILPEADRVRTVDRLEKEPDDCSRMSYLRALAIRELVKQVAAAFAEFEPRMLRGEYEGELIKDTPAGRQGGPLGGIKTLIDNHVYTAASIVETEAAGFEIIGGLLDLFWTAADDAARLTDAELPDKSKKLLQRIPREFLGDDGKSEKDPYLRLLKITDFVTGMTDGYALSLYRKLKGIALPI